MDATTDGELVRQALAGVRPAYGRLAQRWAARVLAVCHARVGRAAAEDLAQEALLRGLRGLSSLADPDKFGAWLAGIADRTCLDWLKSAKRTEVSLDGLAPDAGGADAFPAAVDEARCERRERAERLMAEVQRLPLPYRQALMLYYYQDCTYQELADQLGVSAATINARLTKGRAMLRDRLLVDSGEP